MLAGHPGNAPFLTDAPDLGNIRLHDVERTGFKPGLERLTPREHFATGHGNPAVLAQPHIVIERVRMQRLFKPRNVIIGEHLRSAQRPLITLRPKGVTATRVNHQERVWPDRLARRAHNRFIEGVAATSKWPPTYLESVKPLRFDRAKPFGEKIGLLHQHGSVG